MADSVNVAKDVSIAFLSASALLLTLILGFISPKNPSVSPYGLLDIATFALYLSAGMSAFSLWQLINLDLPVNTRLPTNYRRVYALIFFPFLFGLAFIAAAILITIH